MYCCYIRNVLHRGRHGMGGVSHWLRLRWLNFTTRIDGLQHPKTIFSLLLCCELYALVMYSWLWWGGFGATCTTSTTVLHWGGSGNSSARIVVPVIWCLTLTMFLLAPVFAGHNRWPTKAKDIPNWIMDPLRLFMNVILLCTITVQLFLTGFVLSLLTNSASASVYTIHGCASPVDGRVWIPWSAAGSILLTALLGHLLIPEKATRTKFGWTNKSPTASDRKDIQAISTREVNSPVAVLTYLLTALAVICLWVGFGQQRTALSRTADGNEWLCNCVGASNSTLCAAAKASLFDSLVINEGATMWWVLAGAILLSLFVSLITISNHFAGNRKEWLNSRAIRYTCMLIAAVSVAVLGFGLGGLWGAPSSYLAEQCCATGSCVSLNNYSTAKWALGAVILWIAAIITGHFILKSKSIIPVQESVGAIPFPPQETSAAYMRLSPSQSLTF